jgi:hypothetical protein
MASRLGKVPAGSTETDKAIHEALGRTGPTLVYTTVKSAAEEPLPPGFEWRDAVYAAGQAYASCKRIGMDGAYPYPHHGQWSATEPLAMCGAVLRARAMLAKG